jgi:hypothetical protein
MESHPSENGIIPIEIQELERVEIRLFLVGTGGLAPLYPPPPYIGYQIVGNQLRPLPIGSFLDRGWGVFYWQPGPGFVGAYQLLFVLEGEREKRVNIKINPHSSRRPES